MTAKIFGEAFMPLLALPFPALDPVIVEIGPFAIRWYALAYIAGILLGWLYARAIIRSQKAWGGAAPLTVADFDDFVAPATCCSTIFRIFTRIPPRSCNCGRAACRSMAASSAASSR